jgi:lipopolysaccharide transport system permease protein
MNKTGRIETIRRLPQLWDIVVILVERDMKLRYKRSTIGLAWSMLNPLLQFAVFYLVFRFILPVGRENYGLFLFIGLLAWGWFQNSLQIGCSAIVDHASLVRQPGFAPSALPLATVLSSLLHFLIALPIVFAAAAIAGKLSVGLILGLPFVVLVQFLFTLSIVYAVAALHVSFRDVQYLLSVFLLLGFYLSPVLYAANDVPARFRWFYNINPMVPVLESYHGMVGAGQMPDVAPLLLVGAGSCAVLALTHRLFLKASRWFVEEIGA